ncbi:hypothetical protein VNO78_02713 [Psophocarpus tetragonolobus]|uniref:Uncharacterized protein n=1 Tax=Psophocarpus tetragonolobus TaxID=3891 RepID=A0AAN9T0T2_PSOTE
MAHVEVDSDLKVPNKGASGMTHQFGSKLQQLDAGLYDLDFQSLHSNSEQILEDVQPKELQLGHNGMGSHPKHFNLHNFMEEEISNCNVKKGHRRPCLEVKDRIKQKPYNYYQWECIGVGEIAGTENLFRKKVGEWKQVRQHSIDGSQFVKGKGKDQLVQEPSCSSSYPNKRVLVTHPQVTLESKESANKEETKCKAIVE